MLGRADATQVDTLTVTILSLLDIFIGDLCSLVKAISHSCYLWEVYIKVSKDAFKRFRILKKDCVVALLEYEVGLGFVYVSANSVRRWRQV